MELKDRIAQLPTPIALAGAGVEGQGTLSFLLAQGVRDLRIFDRTLAAQRAEGGAQASAIPGEIPVHGDTAWLSEMPRCGTVFRSPGVRPDHPALQAARAAGSLITSATSFFLEACPGPVAGVTGTVGKGTTATLIHEALQAAGVPSVLGGNIGLNPLAFLAQLRPEQRVVLELSSFQLMDLGAVKPHVAVVLRTSEDHLDWHLSLEEYYRAKAGLLAGESGVRLSDQASRQTVIYCADSAGSGEVLRLGKGDAGRRRWRDAQQDVLAVSLTAPVPRGIGRQQGHVFAFDRGQATPLPALEKLALPGGFNLENAAAALLAAQALGATGDPAAQAIARFPGLPHRLERAGEVRGIACYNDSYATRPDATLGALTAFDQPLALILGGSEKHASFAGLAEAVCRHRSLKRVLLIGATAGRLEGEILAAAERLHLDAPPLSRQPDLEHAFAAGLEALPQGGVLLLSPACASFGLFPNYKVRGERFKALVQAAARS